MMRRAPDQLMPSRRLGWTRFSSHWRIVVFVAAVLGTVAFFVQAEMNALRNPAFTTGYLLLGAVLFLAAYNLRKKLPTLPLGSSKLWMQLHLAVGWTSIGLLGLHVGWQISAGGLELMLFLLFSVVAGSGILGLHLTKSIPKRLASLPTEVVFEQIPLHKRSVADRAKELVLESSQSTSVIMDLYQKRLATFFESPRSVWYFVRPTGAHRRSLQQAAASLDRFLTGDERKLRDKLGQLVVTKDDLDFQQALQLRLKAWLFLHIGFTYSLVIVALIHGLVAHAFHGAN